MKIITSVTFFNDSVGLRMSATFSEVDDVTGEIKSDNQRFDRVVRDETTVAEAGNLFAYAKNVLGE